MQVQGKNWVTELRVARERPAFFIGPEEYAHINAVLWVLKPVWYNHAFADPQATQVVLSPTQYHVKCVSGPLIDPIDGQAHWGDCDILFEELIRVGDELIQQSLQDPADRLQSFRHYHLGSPGTPLILAERGLIAIRTHGGMWCQTYERGWPRSAPVLVDPAGIQTGLVVAAALTPEWFQCLPFKPDRPFEIPGAREVVPAEAVPHLHVEYRSTDDLVTERILSPENIREWL
jgi:hypothetical protein